MIAIIFANTGTTVFQMGLRKMKYTNIKDSLI